MAGDQVVERRAAAAIGHLVGGRAELLRDQHAGEVPERAHAGMRHLGAMSRLLHPATSSARLFAGSVGVAQRRSSRCYDDADPGEILLGLER